MECFPEGESEIKFLIEASKGGSFMAPKSSPKSKPIVTMLRGFAHCSHTTEKLLTLSENSEHQSKTNHINGVATLSVD